jgi:spermidine/putrescine transport system ATP-binding protein
LFIDFRTIVARGGVVGSGLSIENVTKSFPTPEGGEVRALDDVSLEIEDGTFTVLLGPSGCGKTTLLRCIAGLEAPDSGKISLRGARIDDVPVWRRRVNTVFQSYALFPHMTVAENIAFGLQMDKMPASSIATAVSQALEMVQLSDLGNRRPSQLSGGQQQRVALARALAKEPEVLLLDEPLSALDLKLRRGMQSELKRLQRETNITFVLVTHDQEEAMAMGDQVAVFNSGRIVQVGDPYEVYSKPSNRFVADFIGEANVLEASYRGGVVHVEGIGPLSPESHAVSWDSAKTSAFVAVRPESVKVDADRKGPGTITDVTFVGGNLHVEVALGNARLTARQPSSSLATGSSFTVGDTVRVSFDAQSVRVVEP